MTCALLSPNGSFPPQGSVVYPVACVGVVFDPQAHTQSFFQVSSCRSLL
jgi:hypothetical protein